MTISLDVDPATHDKFRGAECFDETSRAVADLVRLRDGSASALRIRVNSILMTDNVAGLTPFLAHLERLGVDEVTFNELGGIERPEFWPAHRLTTTDLSRLREQLSALPAARLRIKLSPGYLRRMAATAEGAKLRVDDCEAISHFLFVDETGRLSPCTFTSAQSPYRLGAITSAEDLLAARVGFRRMQRGLLESGPCSDCKSTYNFGKFTGERA